MSRSRTHHHRGPGTAAAHGHRAAVLDRAWALPHGLASLAAGVALGGLVLLLGLLARTGPVARFDLRVERHIAAHDRTSTLTALARAISTIATPEVVGVGLMILVPVILVLMHRRLDALKVFCMFAVAFALAELGKAIVSEHRPPRSLWAMPAGGGASYPSGHATTAAVLAIALTVTAATLAGRWAAAVLGGLYAVAVAASRVYLADHYLADVIGAMLCAAAAALIITGLAALPALQPFLLRLSGRDPGRATVAG